MTPAQAATELAMAFNMARVFVGAVAKVDEEGDAAYVRVTHHAYRPLLAEMKMTPASVGAASPMALANLIVETRRRLPRD